MKLDDIRIGRESNISIADQIANQLLGFILHGDLDPGERLPPERDLAEYLGVSRGTVKRAYAKLVQSQAIDMRQGSGSYVLKNGHVLEQNQKKEAAGIIAAAFERLRGMGLSEKEILNLVNLQSLGATREGGIQKVMIMVVSNNHDILSELEQQLSYLTDSTPFLFTMSFLTLDTIAGSGDPVQMLMAYDMIIVTSIDYPQILRMSPMVKNKVVEASLSPRTRTLVRLSALPADSRISVIYRTTVFRDMVLGSLVSLDFRRENIFCYLDTEYNPAHHYDNGVSVVVNFNESPVFLDPAFTGRNEEFLNRDGVIMRYEYQLDRSALVYIEDRIQKLLQQERGG